jgi:hypothetical protein
MNHPVDSILEMACHVPAQIGAQQAIYTDSGKQDMMLLKFPIFGFLSSIISSRNPIPNPALQGGSSFLLKGML